MCFLVVVTTFCIFFFVLSLISVARKFFAVTLPFHLLGRVVTWRNGRMLQQVKYERGLIMLFVNDEDCRVYFTLRGDCGRIQFMRNRPRP